MQRGWREEKGEKSDDWREQVLNMSSYVALWGERVADEETATRLSDAATWFAARNGPI